MSGMRIIGPEERAKQARSAVNWLRWEIDIELGAGHQVPSRDTPGQVNASTLAAIAEGIALYRQILATLDAHLPEDDPSRAQIGELLEHYRRYHEVGR